MVLLEKSCVHLTWPRIDDNFMAFGILAPENPALD